MARYLCKNYGGCGKADGKVEVEIPAGVEPLCEECKVKLHPVQQDQDGGVPKWVFPAVGVSLLALVVAGFFIWRSMQGPPAPPPPPPPRIPVNPPPSCDRQMMNEQMKGAITSVMQDRLDEAVNILQAAQRKCLQEPLIDYNLAVVYLKKGDQPAALRSLEACFQKGFKDVASLESDPDFSVLRATAEYRALLGRYR